MWRDQINDLTDYRVIVIFVSAEEAWTFSAILKIRVSDSYENNQNKLTAIHRLRLYLHSFLRKIILLLWRFLKGLYTGEVGERLKPTVC